MKKSIKHKAHQIKLLEDYGQLIAYTKKEKPVVAIFYLNDLPKLKKHQAWRAVFSTEFNCAIIESKSYQNGRAIRTPVASAILNCSPNAPIRHLNGDVLDNRRKNLEIFDRTAKLNDYEIQGDSAKIQLLSRYGQLEGFAIIDAEDLSSVIMDKRTWMKKRRPCGQPFVIDQSGRLLAHQVLNITDGFMLYKNKNPLDNRKSNLILQVDE